jgi:hypothetical protein
MIARTCGDGGEVMIGRRGMGTWHRRAVVLSCAMAGLRCGGTAVIDEPGAASAAGAAGAHGGHGQGGAGDAGGAAGSGGSGTSSSTTGPGLPTCQDDKDCDGYSTCQQGYCCSGTFDGEECTCGDGPGCWVLALCCLASGPGGLKEKCVESSLECWDQ